MKGAGFAAGAIALTVAGALGVAPSMMRTAGLSGAAVLAQIEGDPTTSHGEANAADAVTDVNAVKATSRSTALAAHDGFERASFERAGAHAPESLAR